MKLILIEITHTPRPTAICSVCSHALRATGNYVLLKCNCNVVMHAYAYMYVCVCVCLNFITFTCLLKVIFSLVFNTCCHLLAAN